MPSTRRRPPNIFAKLFGWKIQHMAHIDYWLIDTSEGDEPGINGGIVKRMGAEAGGRTSGQCVRLYGQTCRQSIPIFARAQKLGRQRGAAEDGDPRRRLRGLLQGSRRQTSSVCIRRDPNAK